MFSEWAFNRIEDASKPPKREHKNVWGEKQPMIGESYDSEGVQPALESFLADETIPKFVRKGLWEAVEKRVKREGYYLKGFKVSRRGGYYDIHLSREFRGKEPHVSNVTFSLSETGWEAPGQMEI